MADLEVGQAAEPSEPKQSVPLPPFAGRDTPLTALAFRYSQSVHSSAFLRVCTGFVCVHTYNQVPPLYTYARMYGTYCIMHVCMYVCVYVLCLFVVCLTAKFSCLSL